MIKVELERDDIFNLLRGSKLTFKMIEVLEERHLGRYSDLNGFVWDYKKLDSMTGPELFMLYKECKST